MVNILKIKETKSGKNKDKWRDKVRLILHQLCYLYITADEKTEKKSWYDLGYIPMNSTILKGLCKDYLKVLNLLLKYNIIEVYSNGSYTNNEKSPESRKYKINSLLLFPADYKKGDKIFRKEKITSKPIVKSITRHNKLETDIQNDPILYKIYRTTMNLVIDEIKAIQILNRISKEEDFTNYRHKKILGKILLFNENELYIQCSYGRNHHRLTSIWGEVKECIKIKGKAHLPHMQWDVKNCQPYLLSQLFKENFRTKFGHLIDDRLLTILNSTPITRDIVNFISDCEGGKLWDDMVRHIGQPKKVIKPKTLAMFYSKYFYTKTAEYEYLKDNYPDIIIFLQRVKDLGDDSAELPRSLQKIESTLIYQNISRKLIEKYQFEDFTCVHDSFFFPVENGNRELVYNTIVETFNDLGFTCPKLGKDIYPADSIFGLAA